MISPVLSHNGLAPQHPHQAMPQAGTRVDLLALPRPALEDHLFFALRQAGALDAFALTSRPANKMVKQWRVRECFKEIEAGIVPLAPKDPDEPDQEAKWSSNTSMGALGRQGSALRALRRMHHFFLGFAVDSVELGSLRLRPEVPASQLLSVHLSNLRLHANARIEAADKFRWPPISLEQRSLLVQELAKFSDHFLLPLRTWAFAGGEDTAIALTLSKGMARVIDKNSAEVDLEGGNLHTPPPLACYFNSNLQGACLVDNQFVKVPEEIMLFEHLEVLDLSGNRIRELPDELARLQELRQLRLSHNALNTISPVLFALRSLQELGVDDNPIVHVADGYDFPPSLKTVGVDNASLPVLAPALSGASGLKELAVFSSPTQQHVPSAIGALSHVQTLHLHAAAATTLPAEMGKLQALKTLVVVGDALRQLPEALGELQNLEQMIVLGYALTELPDSLAKCQKLKLLDLAGTGIRARPPQTLQMPNLTKLFMPQDVL